MLVYVLNKNGNPLMPCVAQKARKLLKENRAKVIKREPFTIQLLYGSSGYKQNVSLGVDAGSKFIGLSATTCKKVLFESEVELRDDIVGLLATRREARRVRRYRKTRYRQARFLNRVKSKHKGWLAPSVENKIQSHLTVIERVCKILPVSRIVVEIAAFDIQLLKAKELGLPLPQGKDYQHGEQLYSYNVREYVLFRDNHKCRCCHGKSGDKVLEVHHIESRKTGGDAPNNLIALCRTCHTNYHAGKIKLPESIKRGNSYRDTTFMGIMRWTFYERLKRIYGDKAQMTFGYITKSIRIEHGLPKSHYIDARCISGSPMAEGSGYIFYQKKIRCHNRQIHKFTTLKGGRRKRNQTAYTVYGFRLFDRVKYQNKECFILGRRTRGSFVVGTLNHEYLSRSVDYKKLTFVKTKESYIVEKRFV